MRRAALLVALASIAAPTLATFLRRADRGRRTGVRRKIQGRASTGFWIDDPMPEPMSVKEATDEIMSWYDEHRYGEAEPCMPPPCPPMEEIEINWTGKADDYVPGTFAREAAAYYNKPLPSGDPFVDLIHGFLADMASKEAIAIQTACEQALQTGFMGVRVTRHLDPDGVGGWKWVTEAQATASVPYGMIQGDWGPPHLMGVIGLPS